LNFYLLGSMSQIVYLSIRRQIRKTRRDLTTNAGDAVSFATISLYHLFLVLSSSELTFELISESSKAESISELTFELSSAELMPGRFTVLDFSIRVRVGLLALFFVFILFYPGSKNDGYRKPSIISNKSSRISSVSAIP
jgi:hypothetical protein